ncbi:hypothetical protein BGZ46_004805 [Entomortierella lignicola]|nr:hypothetical protein BGZ46_004805 [Entomortierella lignicola]
MERDKFLVKATDIAEVSTAVICEDNVSREIYDGVFHCAVNCANIDHRWAIKAYNPSSKNRKKNKREKPLAIFMQDRFSDFETEDRTISQSSLRIWYEITLSSVQEYPKHFTVVLVYFTVRKITNLNMEGRGILEPHDLESHDLELMDTSDQ